MDRVEIQSIIQKHIDTAISSTVNLKNSTTVDECMKIYFTAWEKGLKGITIFRDGCKRLGILTTKDTKAQNQESTNINEPVLKRGDIIECSSNLVGKKRKLQTGCGSLHVLAYFDPNSGEMQEVYLNKGSTGGCANFTTGLSRMISLLCRAGVDIYTIKDQLDSTGACPSYAIRSATKHDTSKGSCCPMAIGNALVDMWKEMQDEVGTVEEEEENEEKFEKNLKKNIKNKIDLNKNKSLICPECGEELFYEGGCISCKSCGWSKCD